MAFFGMLGGSSDQSQQAKTYGGPVKWWLFFWVLVGIIGLSALGFLWRKRVEF